MALLDTDQRGFEICLSSQNGAFHQSEPGPYRIFSVNWGRKTTLPVEDPPLTYRPPAVVSRVILVNKTLGCSQVNENWAVSGFLPTWLM